MIKLTNFQMQKQKKSYTCGDSTLSMVSDFLENKIDEEVFEKEFQSKYFGSTPSKFIKSFKRHLPNHSIKLKFLRKKKFLKAVEYSLKKQLPVPFVSLVKNKFENPEFTMHYRIIIGIDTLSSKFLIVDPFYGCAKEIEFEKMFNELSFSETFKDNGMTINKLIGILVKLKGYMVYIINEA